MCGIVGYFSSKGTFHSRKFAASNNMVRYRGPDDYGYITIDSRFNVREWYDENMRDFKSNSSPIGGLGFRRLSIIDLTPAGHQPMCDESGKYYIVHNGEVYNYLELRQELSAKGYEFQSRTDTEVVLKSYMEWGSDCLRRFNGMWSFCILDTAQKKLFCSRDRLGIKPFYYYLGDSSFIFASEIKQVISLLPFKAVMNDHILFDYLALGSYGNETQETFFKGISRLMPGEYLMVDLSQSNKVGVRSDVWWDLPEYGITGMQDKDIYGVVRSLLEDSIRLRLRSEVPLGTCLSGGLDSSGIVCLVDRVIGENCTGPKHKVFVIGSLDPKIDETDYAKIVIDKVNVEAFFKFPDSVDLEKELEVFIWHHDEPLITASMFGGWHVYKLAKERGATVVLDGQGSDELLGGYYFGAHVDYLNELLNKGRISTFLSEFRYNASLHKLGRVVLFKRLLLDKMKKLARYFAPYDFRPKLRRQTEGWLNREFIMVNIPKSHVLASDFYTAPRRFSSVIKKQSYEFTRFTSLPGILRQVDRNSMAFSVEARVPFLDHRLVEFFFRLPPQHILRNGYTKYAYREALKAIIPDEIRLRTDKRGFAMPDRLLLHGALPYVRDIIHRLSGSSNVYDVGNMRKRILERIENEHSYEPIIWRIINAIIWQSKFGIIC
jgi:asparagine synthase (glutamine-hydrolysing)